MVENCEILERRYIGSDFIFKYTLSFIIYKCNGLMFSENIENQCTENARFYKFLSSFNFSFKIKKSFLYLVQMNVSKDKLVQNTSSLNAKTWNEKIEFNLKNQIRDDKNAAVE